MGFWKKEITKGRTLRIRVDDAECEEIKLRAKRACLSVSEYMRRCTLGKRVDMRYDVDAILAITSARDQVLAQLLSLPHHDISPEQARAAFEEVMAAIRRV